MGIYKSLRRHFRTYPAFIVDGKGVVVGWDKDRLTRLLEERIEKDKIEIEKDKGSRG
jgi:hypothetical protein